MSIGAIKGISNLRNAELRIASRLESENLARQGIINEHIAKRNANVVHMARQGEYERLLGTGAAETAKQGSKVSSLYSRLVPESVQNIIRGSIDWAKKPIAESPVYNKIAVATLNGLNKITTKFGAEHVLGKTASSLTNFMGHMGKVAQITPKGFGIVLPLLFEVPSVIQGFREGVGRGIAQTVQSTTKVAGSVVGGMAAVAGATALGVLSGPVGWAALAIGALGSIAGYMAGDGITSWMGKNKADQPQATAEFPTTPLASPEFGKITRDGRKFMNPDDPDAGTILEGLPPGGSY